MQQLVNARAAKAASAQNRSNEQDAFRPFQTVFAGGITADTLFDAHTENIIGCYSDRLVRSGAFREHERGDIKQGFRTLLLRKMENFDPSMSDRYTFAGIVIANGRKNMLKKRDRELKRTGGFLSLQDIPEGCDEPLENAISTDDYEMFTGNRLFPEARNMEYEEAKTEFLNSLTPGDRRIWDALVESDCNIEKASKILRMPARTVLWHFRNPIAKAAKAAGLGEFFGGAR